MEVILVLTQLREMVRSKVLRAAPRTLPLDLTRSLAIPQAVITRQLVLAHSVATQAAVITQPLVLALSFFTRRKKSRKRLRSLAWWLRTWKRSAPIGDTR